MNIKVELYTKAHCLYCQRAKTLLSIKGVNFVEYDITHDNVKAEEMLRRSQRETVPGIFINDALIGGCSELFWLDEKGELDRLLAFGECSGGGSR